MNTVDIVVITIIAISTVIAFLRGFVREMLTIGSWIGAALVTLYGYPVLKPTFEQWISNKLFADIVGGIALFLVSLIVLSIFSHYVARFVRGSALTAVDRSLGLLFGLVRGAVLVSLAYMLMISLDPSLVRGARTQPMMARGAEILRSMTPKEFADGLPQGIQLGAQPEAPGDDKQEPGQSSPTYNKRQNDAMQRLIDAASKK